MNDEPHDDSPNTEDQIHLAPIEMLDDILARANANDTEDNFAFIIRRTSPEGEVGEVAWTVGEVRAEVVRRALTERLH